MKYAIHLFVPSYILIIIVSATTTTIVIITPINPTITQHLQLKLEANLIRTSEIINASQQQQ